MQNNPPFPGQDFQAPFGALFDYATEAILVTDSQGFILRANPSAEKLFGYEHGELTGKPVEVLIPSRFAERHNSHRASFHRSPHPRQMGIGLDLYGLKKDGSELPVEVSLSPVQSEAGNFVIVFIVDNTIRKRYETDILHQKKELEELAEALKSSNKELENFAYISSHDLQEPLNTIRSYLELMEEEAELSPQIAEYLGFVKDSSERLTHLITDLLEHSRIGRYGEAQHLDLNILVSDVLADMKAAIAAKQAILQIGKLPMLKVYPVEMRLLLQNLISNALKFQRQNVPPVISISAEKIEAGWQFTVEDNGIGIEEKYRERIFTIFQRLHTSRQYDGTGIGLAHCKKIVDLHHGRIWVESEVGVGSRFQFVIPEFH